MATVAMAERLRRCQASVKARKADLAAFEARLAAAQNEATQARARADTEVSRREAAEVALEVERAKVASLQAQIQAAGEAERERLSALKTPELELAVAFFPNFFPPWFRAAVGVLALAILAGCTYPLTCSPTWFRSCSSRVEAPVPVPLTAEAPQGFAYSYVWRRGALVVTVPEMPEGRWRVEARRRSPAGEVVLGWMVVTVPPGTSLTEIEVWPSAGRSLGLDAFPVFIEEPHEAAGFMKGSYLFRAKGALEPGMSDAVQSGVLNPAAEAHGERLQGLAVDLQTRDSAPHGFMSHYGMSRFPTGSAVTLAQKSAASRDAVFKVALFPADLSPVHSGLLPGEDGVESAESAVSAGPIAMHGGSGGWVLRAEKTHRPAYPREHLIPLLERVRSHLAPVSGGLLSFPQVLLQVVPLRPEPLPHARLNILEGERVSQGLPETGLLFPSAVSLRPFSSGHAVLRAETRGPLKLRRELVRFLDDRGAQNRGRVSRPRFTRGCRHADPLPALHLAPRRLRHPAGVVPSRGERGEEPVDNVQAAGALVRGALLLPVKKGVPVGGLIGVEPPFTRCLNARLDLRIDLLPADPLQPFVQLGIIHLRLDALLFPLPIVGGDHGTQDVIAVSLVGPSTRNPGDNLYIHSIFSLTKNRKNRGGEGRFVLRFVDLQTEATRQLRLLRVPPYGRLQRVQGFVLPDVAALDSLQQAPRFALFHGIHPPAAYCTKNQEGTQAWTG